MRDGWAGLGHPPWQRGGGGQAEACLQGGVEGVFKGSERPEAGCLGEFLIVRGFMPPGSTRAQTSNLGNPGVGFTVQGLGFSKGLQ